MWNPSKFTAMTLSIDTVCSRLTLNFSEIIYIYVGFFFFLELACFLERRFCTKDSVQYLIMRVIWMRELKANPQYSNIMWCDTRIFCSNHCQTILLACTCYKEPFARTKRHYGGDKWRMIFDIFSPSFFADPRVADWPMMSSPVPTLALCLFYAYFSRSLAPRLMENRKPMDLRNILIFYNLFQTIFSTWIFYEVRLNCYFLRVTMGAIADRTENVHLAICPICTLQTFLMYIHFMKCVCTAMMSLVLHNFHFETTAKCVLKKRFDLRRSYK
jgi:hypothetical protein